MPLRNVLLPKSAKFTINCQGNVYLRYLDHDLKLWHAPHNDPCIHSLIDL